MLISDAISQASSEHHVYFLVAAYIENLQHTSTQTVVPLRLASLPIAGFGDVQRRRDVARAALAMLHRDRDGAYSATRECYEVFAAAVDRVAALREAATALPV